MSLTPTPATRTLPVADTASVRAHTRGLLRRHRGSLLRVIGLHTVAAVAALVAPRVIGLLVDEISNGRSLEVVNSLALWIA
ncbi:MAG TPA: ABC transporter ATP-binding protein, partial [Humibacillus sp.]|nr:ABC transporter ATP-binding protein [Humibacillus sp.]